LNEEENVFTETDKTVSVNTAMKVLQNILLYSQEPPPPEHD